LDGIADSKRRISFSVTGWKVMVKVASSRGGSRDEGIEGRGNLAHFEHKRRTLFNMDNTIFSLTSWGLKPE